MNAKNEGYFHSASSEPHRARTREILSLHPEIRQLMGKNPYTFLPILAVVALQTGLAVALKDQAWWLIFLMAYIVGAIATHALGMMVHECSHNLVFKRTIFNYLSGVLANLPMAVPSSVSFKRYHLKHHAFQGVYELDADLASAWEAKLVSNSSLRKALWLLLFPVFQIMRPPRLREIKPVDGWILFNIFAVFCFDVSLYVLFGPKAFMYLFLSLFFSVGLHPLGARWIQEHYLVRPPQETYSYYGPFNLVSLNIGYHNEHHDFPSVPWNRLPKIKEAAPEWYGHLFAHKSLTRLLFQFLFDPNMSLHSRMVRKERGDEPLRPEFTPDLEILSERQSVKA